MEQTLETLKELEVKVGILEAKLVKALEELKIAVEESEKHAELAQQFQKLLFTSLETSDSLISIINDGKTAENLSN